MRLLKVLSIIGSVFVGLQSFAQSNIPSYVPSNGLVGYWPFNGNANDESGNGNDGVVNGAALTTDRFGNSNQSYQFNMNEITAPIPNSQFANDFTISTWVVISSYSETINNYPTFIWEENAGLVIQAYAAGGLTRFNSYFLNNYGIAGSQVEDGHVQSINNISEWNHVVLVNESGINKLYVNGVLANVSNFASSIQGVQSGAFLKFGHGGAFTSEQFDGKLDDIGIWNRALTQQEITNLYTETTPVSCLPSYVPTNGLVGYWPFCGNANDESGNGNDGVVNGATLTADRFGNTDKAYSFDGVDDKIVSSLETFSGQSMTIACWYNTSDSQIQIEKSLICSRNSFVETNGLFIYYSNSIPNYYFDRSNCGAASTIITPNPIMNSGQWFHYLGTLDNGEMKLYENGQLIASSFNVSPFCINGKFVFGADTSFLNRFFNGKLDDIGIWNRALTQQEITNLYQGSSPFNIISSATSTCAGQPVTLSVTALPGTISGLNCSSAINTGSLVAGAAASNVSSTIPYTGGNGGLQNGQSVSSTGVTGLTATLSGGVLNTGNGNLIYTITGTPSAAGTASFALNIGGQTCTLTLTVYGTQPAYPVGSVFCNGAPTIVNDVTNPITGKVWMDRNLGASQAATSSTDAAAYGDLYQWGRRSDGHQCRNSSTTSTLSTADQPANGNFILVQNAPSDWRNPQNTNLWQGVNGVNNPCPSGYRLPTEIEINAERLSWSQDNSAGAFASPLKFPIAGYRSFNDGSLNNVGNFSDLWTSTISGTNSRYILYDAAVALMYDGSRAHGFSVRCIKEITGTLGAINCGAATNTGTLTATTAASGVNSSIPYTGGNAGSHNGQTVTSTGVTGLTATLTAGSFANGAGTLIYTITGTPSAAGTASFALNIGGQTCTLTFTVSSNLAAQYPAGSVFCAAGPTAIVDVTNPVTGKVWMDRNLGASQVATSSTDANAYGDLYQWGRRSDGHQCRNSATTSTLSSSDQPGNGNFILAPNSPNDWLSLQNNNLWQGVNGVNNPCPDGYRLPSEAEINSERLSWSENNSTWAFSSPLKYTLAGRRIASSGFLYNVGTSGNYWSSSISDTFSRYLNILGSNALIGTEVRAYGCTVRCIKD